MITMYMILIASLQCVWYLVHAFVVTRRNTLSVGLTRARCMFLLGDIRLVPQNEAVSYDYVGLAETTVEGCMPQSIIYLLFMCIDSTLRHATIEAEVKMCLMT